MLIWQLCTLCPAPPLAPTRCTELGARVKDLPSFRGRETRNNFDASGGVLGAIERYVGLKLGKDIPTGRILTRVLEIAICTVKANIFPRYTPITSHLGAEKIRAPFISLMVYKPRLGVGDTFGGGGHPSFPYFWWCQ